jgi:hypothetical protein
MRQLPTYSAAAIQSRHPMQLSNAIICGAGIDITEKIKDSDKGNAVWCVFMITYPPPCDADLQFSFSRDSSSRVFTPFHVTATSD